MSASEQQAGDLGPPQNGALQRLQMLLELVAAVCRAQQVGLPFLSCQVSVSGWQTSAAPLMAAATSCVPMC